MLYWLLYPLNESWIGFNVFRYITFRTGLAIATDDEVELELLQRKETLQTGGAR